MRSIFLLSWLLMAACLTAAAQPITVDGDDSDWTSAQLAPVGQNNIGQIARDAAGNGQYVWSDRTGDERTDVSPSDPADLVEVRMTGDATNLYVMVRMADIFPSGEAPIVQLAIDTDRITNSGTNSFGGDGDGSRTGIDPNAAWERLLITRFGSSTDDLFMWIGGFSNSQTFSSVAINDGNNVIEFSVPWSDLGISNPSAAPIRFSLSTYLGTNANVVTVGSTSNSNALDAITNYGGDPGAILNTFDDVGDGTLNYYFDLYFDSDGDVISPVLISEVMYNPDPVATNEFVELYNLLGSSLDLTGWVLSDEEVIDFSPADEGAEQFNTGTIPANGSLVIARDATEFSALYGFSPDLVLGTSDFSTFANWFTGATGTPAGIILEDDDEVFLLDNHQTIVDVVAFGASGNWPGVLAPLTAPAGSSIERTFADIDTDDITADFTVVGGGNPGDFVVFPVEWAYFTAQPRPEGAVRLAWGTAAEVNNWQFVVERSVDGQHFEALGRVAARGEAASYSFDDARPQAGANYYRIRQIDYDGASTVSELAMVRISDQQAAVYPNPVRERLHVDLRLNQPGLLRLWLTDTQGRTVRTLWGQAVEAGPQALRFDLSDLPAGAYLLQGQAPGLRLRQPLLRQ